MQRAFVRISRLKHTSQLMCKDLIYITKGYLLDIHELCTDLMDSIILVNKEGI